jgi:hypothetical protein
MFFQATIIFVVIDQLLPVPEMYVRSLEMITGFPAIVGDQHSMNHNKQSLIWPL